MFRVLFLGETVGFTTVKLLRKYLKDIKTENNIDFVIANANGASDGFGLLPETAYFIKKAGVDIMTSGDLVFNKKDIADVLTKTSFLLRPYNLPQKVPGKGIYAVNVNEDLSVGVVNIMGRININKILASDPFVSVDNAIERLSQKCKIIIVDFHGGTTSEIQSMQWYLAGRVSAVIGTHLKVLTSDNRIIKDTAVLTGAGFCGGSLSIMGLAPSIEAAKIKTGRFIYSKVVGENIVLQGAIIEIDETTGKAVNIDLFVHPLPNE